MTPVEALHELLARLGASQGEPVLVSEEELKEWPESAVRAMRKAGLLVAASPASSVVCPGCEQQCFMPVNMLQAGNGKSAFVIFCDKRDDIYRVPVSGAMLKQWSASLTALAGIMARLLGITGAVALNGLRCEVGVFRGKKHFSHVVLVADGDLTLHAAGHSIPVADLLAFKGESMQLDKPTIVRLVDKPIAGAGDGESAQTRRERLTKLVHQEKARGNKAFLKTVAEREGFSTSRLKQILRPPASKPRNGRNLLH